MLPRQPQTHPSTPAFRRTTQSCRRCQGKKSRCDRKTFGSACTNCLLDGLECVPGKSKPQRSGKSRVAKSRPSTIASISPQSNNIPLPTNLPEAPSFFKPFPIGLKLEDLDYLKHKGVFDLPNAECRSEILRSYFLFVYPLLPLLDVDNFLVPILEGDSDGKISLLLFYAVMCAGAGHVDMQVLRVAGFESRKAARSAFFERARLLYDFDCEPDRVSLIQAFLLMTYWYGGPETLRDRTFWIRQSVTVAQDLGLDINLESCHTKRHRMLKRLWWCCFMRDQFVALMIWTPPQLGARHRHLPMLDLEDFELQDISATWFDHSPGWDFLSSREGRIHLANLCIAKAKLCVSINQILHTRYSNLRCESGDRITVALVPRRSSINAFEIFELDRELREWYYGLSDMRGSDLRGSTDSAFVQAFDVVAMHRAQLKLLFYSALIALHRPQALDAACQLPPMYQQMSKTKLHEAANEIAHFAISIKDLQMGTNISPKGLNLLLPIMLAHLQDVQPVTEIHQRSRLEKYHDSMRALDIIGDLAGSKVDLPPELESAFFKFNILPSQGYSIPQSISFQAMSDNRSPTTQGGVFPYLLHLGTITTSEVAMLADMGSRPRRLALTGITSHLGEQLPSATTPNDGKGADYASRFSSASISAAKVPALQSFVPSHIQIQNSLIETAHVRTNP